MIVGISIDGVLRDFLGKFKSLYIKEFDKDPIEPFTSLDLLRHFPFEDIDKLYYFLYEEFSLELFGHSNEKYKNVINDLNKLQEENKDDCEIVLTSKEFGNAIPATLFFLSKTSCKIRNYRFVKHDEKVWDFCDVMITTNPIILESKPNDKISIKIKCDYNDKIDSTYEVDTLKNILEDKLLLNVLNTKIISYIKID